ncbi:MAG: hypothetical protein AAF215_23520 [Cyanobacteria bacterium P01_A01_bin.123]
MSKNCLNAVIFSDRHRHQKSVPYNAATLNKPFLQQLTARHRHLMALPRAPHLTPAL